jgi:hypothetical protein
MDIFPKGLLGNLRRAIKAGELRREDTLDTVGDKLTAVFHCDSLDLVELTMKLEEKPERLPKTVGDLIDLIEHRGPDKTSSPIARK